MMTPKEFYEAHEQEDFLSKPEILGLMQLYNEHVQEEKENLKDQSFLTGLKEA
jgi:hypothetical protein